VKGCLIVTTASDDDPAAAPGSPDEHTQLRPRPPVLYGSTYRALTPVGTAFVTVNSDVEGNIREVFVTVGRAGSDIMADAEALGRLISLAFRIPTSLSTRQVVEAVIDQLAGIGGSSSLGFGPKRVRSLADAVAQVLAEHSGLAKPITSERANKSIDRESVPNPQNDESTDVGRSESNPSSTRERNGDFCPNCGQMALVNEEGCRKCYSCGFSSC
jgi:ribonucleoside-diphosphate reductase alpha chain